MDPVEPPGSRFLRTFAGPRRSLVRELGLLVPLALASAACGDSDGAVTTTTTDGGGDALTDLGDAGGDAAFVSQGPYPAPHPAMPQMRTQGGAVLARPRLVPVFWPNDEDEAVLTTFLQKYASSSELVAQVAEYGGGQAFVTPAAHPTNRQPAVLLDGDVQTWLATELDSPTSSLPVPDERTLYLLYFPVGVNLAFIGGGSVGCQDFDGYHGNITWHGKDVAYAAFPRCPQYSGHGEIDELTGATSHEIVESTTDPFPYTQPAYFSVDPLDSYWPLLMGGGEVADLCTLVPGAFDYLPGLTYASQRSYSNAAALAGHDPCVPAPAGPYAAAIAVLPEEASYDDGFGSILHTHVVTIPIGGSRDVEIDLFSDGPTDGPWTVSALDDTSVHGASKTLDMQLDRTTGGNGDKLTMTIQVVQAPTTKIEGFWLFSVLNGRTSVTLGMVVNP